MPTISTPFGRFPVSDEGKQVIETALQNGGRYRFKLAADGVDRVTLTGHIRRDRARADDYVIDLGPAS